MKFLIDAQLPRSLARRFRRGAHDAIHTLDLPRGNKTLDPSILAIAEGDDRVVVTKDNGFVNSFVSSHRPRKLFLISTGNITNDELESLVESNLVAIVKALETADFVELTRSNLIVHS